MFYDMKHITKFIKENNVDIVIIPSNFRNFQYFTRELNKNMDIKNIKFIYEVRGLWYLSGTANAKHNKTYKKNKAGYIKRKKGEIKALKACDGCVYITDEVKEYILNVLNIKSLQNKPTEIVYNGQDTKITKLPKKKVGGKFTIGYFGTISDYEGIEMLISVCGEIFKEGHDICLYIIGTNRAGLDMNKPYITYKKWVESDILYKEYEKIDIFCLPRLPYTVCDIISPLKPFDPLYYQVPLLMSDCKCLSTIAQNGRNCMLFKKGSKNDLKKKILNVIKNGYDDRLVKNGYDFVLNDRNWEIQCKKYERYIDSLIQ